MDEQLENLDYEGWVKYVFDHEVNKIEQAWYFAIDADWWDESKSPATTLEYMTHAFVDIENIATHYSDEQMNQGLDFLINNACSNHIFMLLDTSITLEKRNTCVKAWYTVFETIFARKCTPTLGHLDEENPNPLNSVCYMWWDVMPIYGEQHGGLKDAIFELMQHTLALEHDACRESALHGLGHWQMYFPKRVKQIIDEFLKSHRKIRPELKSYALQARQGMVL